MDKGKFDFLKKDCVFWAECKKRAFMHWDCSFYAKTKDNEIITILSANYQKMSKLEAQKHFMRLCADWAREAKKQFNS